MGGLLFFAFVTMCLSSLANGVKYRDCGSHEGKPSEVTVSSCSSEPCELIKGTNATINIIFKANKDVPNVTAKLVGVIASVPIPFPIPHPDVCNYTPSQLRCPLKAGKTENFKLVLPVKDDYPSMKLEAKLYLLDGNKNIVCVEIPLQIKSKSLLV